MKKEKIKDMLQHYNRINMRIEYNERMGFNPENVRALKEDFSLMNTTMEYIDRELYWVLDMIYKSRKSIRRTGTELNYSDSTVKRRMQKAIEQIAEMTEQNQPFEKLN